LVNTPIEPEVTAIDTVLSGVCFNTAWAWQQGQWAIHTAQGAEATAEYAASKNFALFTDIHAGAGFWIRGCGTSGAVLTIQGQAATETQPVYQPGWNLVGLQSVSAKPVAEVLSDQVISAWSWDAGLGSWRVYLKEGQDEYLAAKGFKPFVEIGPHDGFWVNTDPGLEEPPTPPTLEPVASCTALIDGFKAEAIKRMEEQVDRYRDNYLTYGCSPYTIWWYPEAYIDMNTGAAPPSDKGASAQSYSETNVQVAGVDESDFVKNDGKYIYILAEKRFRIVDAWPPEQAHEIASLAVEGEPSQMFVTKGKAFIYSTVYAEQQGLKPGVSWGMPIMWDGSYDYYGQSKMKITVVDLAEITTPAVIREMTFNGSYLNSRRIGNAVHTAATFPAPQITGLTYWPEELSTCYQWYGYGYWQEDGTVTAPEFSKEQVIALFEVVKEQNRATILATDLNQWLPSVTDVHHSAGQTQKEVTVIGQCTDYYQAPVPEEGNQDFLSLISTAMDGSGSVNGTTIIGQQGTVYASADALYVASSQWRQWGRRWFFADKAEIQQATLIHKFALDNEQVSAVYKGSGVVKGNLDNQFHMDEYNSALRVATGIRWGEQPGNTVSVLKEVDGALQVVGQVDGIAPGEEIRSVRFDGERGFVVTFKNTDPLFALDLSEPTAPTITGELKIPGFSTYIHMLGPDHLLTIGYDAEDMGDFAWFQGIMLQIFDVSSMTTPTLLHKEVIGTRGTASEAASDHHAFNYFPDKGVLAIPMVVCEGGDKGEWGSDMTFNGLMVYDVSIDSGFSHRGDIAHPFPPEYETFWGGECSQWWSNPDSLVKRSVFMDDYVFSITNNTIKVASLNDLATALSVITFPKVEPPPQLP
jgi:uncharacterized secreted protein with C-terminal beta-propeller domain